MPQYDPTLDEATLITKVQQDKDSSALKTLVNRHTGMYFSVVHRYSSNNPNVIKIKDLDDDKLFNIYQFVMDYDPTRGMKLSSYIGDRTKYLCKGMLKEGKKDPLTFGFANTGMAPIDESEEGIRIEDSSPATQVAERVNTDIGVEDIVEAAKKVCTDERFFTILEHRHLSNPPLSWRKIGPKVGLTYEGARRIVYEPNMAKVRECLGVV